MTEHTDTAAPPSRSARERVSDALQHWLANGEQWPPADPARFRNLLLDATGSDHRPLVELLLRVGRHGIVDALRAHGANAQGVNRHDVNAHDVNAHDVKATSALSTVEWTAWRSALVARTTSTLFIDNDVAAWAVDSWAVALGVISPEALREQRALHAASSVQDSTTLQPAKHGKRGRAAASTVSHGAAANARLVPGAPSWAGGPGATRVGVVYSNTGRRVRTGWRGSSGPVHVPNVRRNLMVLSVVLMLALLLAMLARRASARAQTAESAAAGSRSGPSLHDSMAQAAVDSGAAGLLSSDSIGRSPVGAATSDTVVPRSTVSRGAVPRSVATRTSPPPSVPTLTPSDDFAPLGALDTISLHDGRTLVGSIRLVAPTALFVHDVRSGLEYTLPYSQVRSVITRTGTAMPLPLSEPDDAMAVTTALLNRGVGGTYRVEQRVQSVDGSSTCDEVAHVLGRSAIQSVEEFSHVPGSREFVFTSRPGVRGSIDEQARFASIPHAAERNGVRIVFRMSGYFTPGGFVARAITETEANIRYRQTQRCRIVADLLGSKSVPGTDNPSVGEPKSSRPR